MQLPLNINWGELLRNFERSRHTAQRQRGSRVRIVTPTGVSSRVCHFFVAEDFPQSFSDLNV